MIEEILDKYPDVDFIVADGYENAIIGVDESSLRLIYSVDKCIEVLIMEQDMTEEEAIDWFYYNTIRANDYMGERAPIFCHDV